MLNHHRDYIIPQIILMSPISHRINIPPKYYTAQTRDVKNIRSFRDRYLLFPYKKLPVGRARELL